MGLDIANAYGSLPHKVIMKTFEEAHVPEDIINMVGDHYSDARIGCTLSVVLFSLAMTWIVMSVKKETKGPKLSSVKIQVNSRLLMDTSPGQQRQLFKLAIFWTS